MMRLKVLEKLLMENLILATREKIYKNNYKKYFYLEE